MSSWSSWLLGRELRQHLIMLEKKEDHLNKKIDDELKKAKANATTNKRAATAALRQKKLYEQELDQTQVNAIESANMNLETMQAMRRGADVLKGIHGNLLVLFHIEPQLVLAPSILDWNGDFGLVLKLPLQLDEDEIKAELEELEQDELKSRLVGADSVPLHAPSQSERPVVAQRQQEEDEDAELKELQAALAM
ncbi:hypothetical protein PPACK8108_LOCUS17043 [Phakopsora pachyrhizi]|uniref:Vacuolar-sorting protein SNF7 n=1 Tax=Phakopsora pachyrhizi TaxID=170000 RepID=A0AAV0BAT4_PHAPC|nr:hypothetical protein PPACK8108_LOCUS16297 [Phakopsora pachyrhizi]CAH7683492.1 hypothetical protein PPACK8108_LOCUS17043 [Phakopsora pachyrhizi]